MTEEGRRLEEARQAGVPWRKWGPYLAERQWGTVREDYSDSGNAWDYFSHDQARSRAYRWGEDGLGGISDDHQRLCFALALWNGVDPIVKERLFGLTNSEGNHGEDVKEYYFYLDSTPTHSYMKYLYKYPQSPYPYSNIVDTNRGRGRHQAEYELLDTGVFDGNRYFDVFVEYAKAAPEDILVVLTIVNRGPERASLHVLPTLWFRNTWSWGGEVTKLGLRRLEGPAGMSVVAASHAELGERYLYCDRSPALLFTENETNAERLFGAPNCSPWVKDAINESCPARHEGRRALSGHRGGGQERGDSAAPLARRRRGTSARALRRLRRGRRRAPARGRRVLRIHHAIERHTGRRSRDAPGARGDALEQAGFLLRRRALARRARRRSVRIAWRHGP